MKSQQIKNIVFSLCFILTTQFSSAQKNRPIDHSVIDSLFQEYDNSTSPGIAVSVNKHGKTIYQNGFGMANLEYGIPITEKTNFHVASLSKQFTAFLILTLEEKGLISIHDEVRDYIPELPNYEKPVTINHLLTHSSGLRDQWRLLELAGWRMDDVIKTEQVFKLITNQKELNFLPGENFKYSNSGYTLLAIIIERITKMSFAEYAKKTIFEPLNMTNSFFYDDHEIMIPNRAYSYKKDKGILKKSILNFATVGPTSLFTTIEDFNKWAQNFSKMDVGNTRTFQLMNKKARKNDGSTTSYAKGQFVRTYKGFKMIYHSGSDAGYRCYFVRFPEIGFEFTLFANASYISSYTEIYKLIDVYLQDYYPINKSSSSTSEDFIYDDDLFNNLSSEELKKYEGNYFDREEKQYWRVELQNDTLHCKGGILSEFIKLHPVSENNFKIKGSPYDISVNFRKNDHNEPVLEFKIPDVMWLWLAKVEKVDTLDYLGTYYNDEVNAHYILKKKENELYLTHLKLDDIKINQINDVYFSSENRNFSNMRFHRDNSGHIVSFSVNNMGIENIIFKKL